MKSYFSSILKQIRILYPKELTLLSILPLLVGLFINYDLIEFREFVLNFIWLPIFTFPMLILRNKKGFWFLSFVYFSLGFIELTHWLILNGPISLTSILVLSNTNTQEAGDFIDQKITFKLLFLLPYIYVFYKSLLRTNFQKTNGLIYKILIPYISILLIFIVENATNNRLARKGLPHSAKVMVFSYRKFELFKEARRSSEPKENKAFVNDVEKSETFVLVIGESCNRNHMSLYGYDRKTNPKLETRNDIVVYKDVVSAYSSTLNSVLTMLAESNLDNKIEITRGLDILDVFHSAGFQTSWISNQSPIGIWDNMITVFANKADNTKFVNLTSNSSIEATYNVSYDEKVLEVFMETLNKPKSKKLIIVHLMGSHSKYSKRYPNSFDVFKGDNKKEREIAEYDNSILYNDYIVDSIFTILRNHEIANKETQSSALYIADHGENVYDEFDAVGHDFSNILPKSNVEIPFVVWISKSYKLQNEKKTTLIKNNFDKPFVSDDLFHSILDINSINSSKFDSTRSNFSPSFNYNRKRFLENKKDYDLGY